MNYPIQVIINGELQLYAELPGEQLEQLQKTLLTLGLKDAHEITK